jgi:hypothetical protein
MTTALRSAIWQPTGSITHTGGTASTQRLVSRLEKAHG